MEYYVGLDVSLKQTSICVVDQTGSVVRESVVDSDPEAISVYVRSKAPGAVRIGLETGPTSTWLWTELKQLGLPVICIDARHAKAVLKMQINKSDRNDAIGIARIMQTGWFKEVHVKDIDSHFMALEPFLFIRRGLQASNAQLAARDDARRHAAEGAPRQHRASRLIGSTRRECADYAITHSEVHLRWILRSYAFYKAKRLTGHWTFVWASDCGITTCVYTHRSKIALHTKRREREREREYFSSLLDRETEVTTVQVFQSIGRLGPWPYGRTRQDGSPASGQILLFYLRNRSHLKFDVDQRCRSSAMLNGSRTAICSSDRSAHGEVAKSEFPAAHSR